MSTLPHRRGGTPPSLLAVVLTYHARGWCVIPAVGKRACATWKRFQAKRPSEEQLRTWFSNVEAKNIAVILGEVSGGLVCRDFDVVESYVAWSQAHPELAESLPTAWTPRGRHVYFRMADDQIRPFGKAYCDLGDGELRLRKCYCILPPSTHPDGNHYRWIVPPATKVPVLSDLAASGLGRRWSSSAAKLGTGRPTGKLTEHAEHTEHPEQSEQSEHPERTEAISGRAPFAKYAKAARGCEDAVKQAVEESLPQGPGERNYCLFELVRRLKAIPEMATVKQPDLERIVAEWHKRALPVIRTKDYYVTLSEFLTAWDNVLFPEGCDPMLIVLEQAKREPTPKCARRFEDPRMQRLVAVCRVLQRYAGDREFYLSCRTAATFLELSHEVAARWLRLLQQLRIIQAVGKYERATGKAKRYRYLGD